MKALRKGLGELVVQIKAPNFQTAQFEIEGTAPFGQHKFSAGTVETMRKKQEEGSTAKKGKAREGKDFEAAYIGATYVAKSGEYGINAAAFRCAAISACRLCGFKMTLAKLALFIEADGYDAGTGTPLVFITKGKPHMDVRQARNSNGGMDLRSRPLWNAGWRAKVRITFDGDIFTQQDIANLMMRIGQQVGIGEGRPDSKMSAGIGWGTFKLVGKGE